MHTTPLPFEFVPGFTIQAFIGPCKPAWGHLPFASMAANVSSALVASSAGSAAVQQCPANSSQARTSAGRSCARPGRGSVTLPPDTLKPRDRARRCRVAPLAESISSCWPQSCVSSNSEYSTKASHCCSSMARETAPSPSSSRKVLSSSSLQRRRAQTAVLSTFTLPAYSPWPPPLSAIFASAVALRRRCWASTQTAAERRKSNTKSSRSFALLMS
mmetsp:Transcript_81589/g.227222  ORF Transcript_81589/g.227222 Transcript_81589/m.227222 type:complete len:216 (-) Transcript_81589:399-1046(-)